MKKINLGRAVHESVMMSRSRRVTESSQDFSRTYMLEWVMSHGSGSSHLYHLDGVSEYSSVSLQEYPRMAEKLIKSEVREFNSSRGTNYAVRVIKDPRSDEYLLEVSGDSDSMTSHELLDELMKKLSGDGSGYSRFLANLDDSRKLYFKLTPHSINYDMPSDPDEYDGPVKGVKYYWDTDYPALFPLEDFVNSIYVNTISRVSGGRDDQGGRGFEHAYSSDYLMEDEGYPVGATKLKPGFKSRFYIQHAYDYPSRFYRDWSKVHHLYDTDEEANQANRDMIDEAQEIFREEVKKANANNRAFRAKVLPSDGRETYNLEVEVLR